MSGPLRRLLTQLRATRGRLALTLAAGLVARAADIALGGVAAWLVAVAVTGGSREALSPGIVLVAAAGLVAVAASYVEQWAAHDAAFRIIAQLRVGLFDGIRRCTPRLLLDRRSGDVAAAAMSDAEGLEWFYAHTVATYAIAAIVPSAAVAGLAAISPVIAGVVAAAAVAVGIIPAVLRRRAAAHGDAVRAAVACVHADVLEGVQALRDFVLLRAEPVVLARIRAGSGALARAQAAFGSRRGAEIAAGDALLGAAVLAVLAVAGAQVAAGHVPAARLPVLAILTGAVLAPVAAVTASAALLGQTRASASRVLTVLDAPANVADADEPADHGQPDRSHDPVVEFRDVRFRYPGAHVDALRGASFTVRPGEVLALAGRSGAGKTTCASLLLRLWDVAEGAVSLGGVDVRRIGRGDLARFVGWVPQEVGLIRGSVADNLRLGAPNAPDEDLLAVIADVGADDVLAAVGGLGGMIGEGGATLSGGQRRWRARSCRTPRSCSSTSLWPTWTASRHGRRWGPPGGWRLGVAPCSSSPTSARPCWPPTAWCCWWTDRSQTSLDAPDRLRLYGIGNRCHLRGQCACATVTASTGARAGISAASGCRGCGFGSWRTAASCQAFAKRAGSDGHGA